VDYRNLALYDFDRALARAFWRKILSWIRRKSNRLLPFDEVREKLPMRGQRYLGMTQVPIDRIVGSMGRYHDFDRAFLPTHSKNRDRWVSIDVAHYGQVVLPPVELYKIGEIYFVKDGNHRISVARERGQLYVDAYVTEIDVPVPLSTDLTIDELELKRAYAAFLEQTRLDVLRPGADLESRLPGQYELLLEHIDVHRWYLGENSQREIPYSEAVTSWYDTVYTPVVEVFRQQGLVEELSRFKEVDLYLWVMKYQAYLREAYREEIAREEAAVDLLDEAAREEASRQFAEEHPRAPVKKLIQAFNQATWLDEIFLRQERAAFFRRTNLAELRPQAQISSSIPGQYERLLEHIRVHRWYLGIQRNQEVPYEEAVLSWYDNVYMPLVRIIRKEGILKDFPDRTETDLYMWIITRQWVLRQLDRKE